MSKHEWLFYQYHVEGAAAESCFIRKLENFSGSQHNYLSISLPSASSTSFNTADFLPSSSSSWPSMLSAVCGRIWRPRKGEDNSNHLWGLMLAICAMKERYNRDGFHLIFVKKTNILSATVFHQIKTNLTPVYLILTWRGILFPWPNKFPSGYGWLLRHTYQWQCPSLGDMY